jgi:hypothetical protein
MNSEQQPRVAASASLIVGICIVLLGSLLFLSNLGWVSSHIVWKLSPLVLVIIGGAKLYQRRGEPNIGPIFLIGLGCLLLLRNFHLASIEDIIGPLFVIGAGIFIVTQALKKQRQVPQHLLGSQDFVQGTAIFGGFKRRVLTQNFQGGEITAIFGGFEADLREAKLEGQVRLDAFVLFGGGELLVPEDWDVVIRATALFGHIEDKTRHHLPTDGAPRPTLIITGQALFGAMEIKHA